MKCYIARDLLPNYVDDLNSEETNSELRGHLNECADCRTIYERMVSAIQQVPQAGNEDIDFLKRLKAKILKKNIIISISTCIVVLGGLLIFANTYEMPIPFDPYRMTVRLTPVAVVANEDGSTTWWELSTLNPQEGTTVTSDANMPKDYEYVMDVLTLSYQGLSNISESRIGRNINRDGHDVRVVYYHYSKTPWVSLFFDYDLADYRATGSSFGSDIYGDSYESGDYEPQMIEIYYLPIRNLHKFHDLSDDDYDAQRENGVLIWSGVI